MLRLQARQNTNEEQDDHGDLPSNCVFSVQLPAASAVTEAVCSGLLRKLNGLVVNFLGAKKWYHQGCLGLKFNTQ